MTTEVVHKLNIPPKQVRETYRKQQIVVTYVPATGEWAWKVEFTAKLTFDGEAKTQHGALNKAREQVNKLLGKGD